MRFVLRLAYLAAAVASFAAMPVGDATVLFALTLSLDLAAAAWVLRLHLRSREHTPAPVMLKAAHGAEVSLGLLRRTVPALRMRRPAAVVDAQVRWRSAAETRRLGLRRS